MPGGVIGSVPNPKEPSITNTQTNLKNIDRHAKGPDPLKLITDPANAVKKGIDSAAQPFKDLGAFFTELFSASLWERIGLIILGVGLVIIGIVLLLHKAVPNIPVPIPEVPVP